jgi:hypothetical protein
VSDTHVGSHQATSNEAQADGNKLEAGLGPKRAPGAAASSSTSKDGGKWDDFGHDDWGKED